MFGKKKEEVDLTHLENQIDELNARVVKLEDETILLRLQVSKLIELHPNSSIFRKLT